MELFCAKTCYATNQSVTAPLAAPIAPSDASGMTEDCPPSTGLLMIAKEASGEAGSGPESSLRRNSDSTGDRAAAPPLDPSVASLLTGVSDEMVAGRAIDPAKVEAFVADASIVIAHNTRSDRPIAQRTWPTFKSLDWACSLDEIPWRENGYEGATLAYLLMAAGLFADAHRAVGDCRALLHILSAPSASRRWRRCSPTPAKRQCESLRSIRPTIARTC